MLVTHDKKTKDKILSQLGPFTTFSVVFFWVYESIPDKTLRAVEYVLYSKYVLHAMFYCGKVDVRVVMWMQQTRPREKKRCLFALFRPTQNIGKYGSPFFWFSILHFLNKTVKIKCQNIIVIVPKGHFNHLQWNTTSSQHQD